MRIIAGHHRSRRLIALAGFHTRPMPDRVRESVFGMLGTRVENAAVLDLFSGSGAIGLEAVSRGAASCLMVDNDSDAIKVIEKNIAALRETARCRAVHGDALGLAIIERAPRPLDLVFFDPPYPLVMSPAGLARVKAQATQCARILAPDGFLILRTPWPFFLEAPAAGAVMDPLAPATTRPVRRHKEGKYRRENKRWEEESGPPDRPAPRDRRAGTPSPRGTPALTDESADPFSDPGGEWVMRIDDPAVAAKSGFDGSGEPDRVRVNSPDEVPAAVALVPADLAISGCKGPETHAYGTTAVHWYMAAAAEQQA